MTHKEHLFHETIMDYVVFFVIIIFRGFVLSDMLNLSLPKYAIAGEHIWVTCSSDIVPYEQIAEFLVNGVTTDIIRRDDNKCFSSITRHTCSSDACNCSSDGKSYSTNLLAKNEIGNIAVTCYMKFKLNEEVFQTKHVHIKILEKTSEKENELSIAYEGLSYQLSTNRLTFEGTTVARIDQSLLYSSTAKLETDKKSEEIHNKEGFLYMFLVVSLVLGLCFFSLPIIWMILKNKYMEGQRGIAHLGITRQETNSSQSNDIVLQEIDSSDYESIKDSEVNDPDMLEIINRLQLRDSKMVKTTTTPWTQNNLNISNSTAKHYSSNSNSTESPNHSYLDVIADTDYLNPYQIINMNECEEDEHSYCTTLDESRGGSNSIGNASLHLQKIGCPPGNTKYISLSQKTLVQKSALNNTRMSYSDGDINLYLKTRGEDAILRDHSANNNEIREGANSKWVIKANIAMDVRNADCAPRNCAYSNVVSPVYNITSKNAMSTLL